jgi:hypothetical protein
MPTQVLRRTRTVVDVPLVEPLRTVSARNSELVHLAPLRSHIPVQGALCNQVMTRQEPTQLFQVAGCPRCADLALKVGVTYALDSGALVNLRRVRRRLRRRREERLAAA